MTKTRIIRLAEPSQYVAVYNDATMTLSFRSPEKPDDSFTLAGPAHRENASPDQPPVGLSRLSLVVSNACNMTCAYCYANLGAYYSPGRLMPADIALKSINYLLQHYTGIGHLNFFGGEPTLNEKIIGMVCEYCRFLKEKGRIARTPGFGLTTNGLHLSDSLLSLLSEYRFSVSVSLDGPSEIHDRLRTKPDGAATFALIDHNVERLRELGFDLEFECTYTMEHYHHNIYIDTLMDFFFDRYRCKTLHCPMVVAPPGDSRSIPLELRKDLYTEAIRASVHNLAVGTPKAISPVKRWLNAMTAGRPIQHYCPAGGSTLAVNTDGRIYPCFMLMNDPTISLGRIDDDVPPQLPAKLNDYLQLADKWRHAQCNDCWIQSLCYGCLGEDSSRCGKSDDRSSITGTSAWCDYRRSLVETFLRTLAEEYFALGRSSAPYLYEHVD